MQEFYKPLGRAEILLPGHPDSPFLRPYSPQDSVATHLCERHIRKFQEAMERFRRANEPTAPLVRKWV